jgi:hypothetical protein
MFGRWRGGAGAAAAGEARMLPELAAGGPGI